MIIHIISVGRLKDKWLREGCAEYIKMISGHAQIRETEIPDEKLPDSPSEKLIAQALSAEAERITAAIPKGSAVIAMCIEGKQLSSEELSARLDDLCLQGKSTVTFLIGSSYGLADSLKAKADVRLSMSRMTFPHRLAKVMLCEQIYRALSISSGGRYHK
ncbi:MAG: 23S rRNA (pseudouridine(1915)-N(3))-methyltransferase RlmH [Oscillospiraceae bacterium]|nr:23S rRNA (pseudouridine(1915)-N(3))-methyltransferase RlmH [Oscillospiraceae bacterium]